MNLDTFCEGRGSKASLESQRERELVGKNSTVKHQGEREDRAKGVGAVRERFDDCVPEEGVLVVLCKEYAAGEEVEGSVRGGEEGEYDAGGEGGGGEEAGGDEVGVELVGMLEGLEFGNGREMEVWGWEWGMRARQEKHFLDWIGWKLCVLWACNFKLQCDLEVGNSNQAYRLT